MAMKSDGSVVIDTKIDETSLKKGISSIGSSLKGITKLIAVAFSVKVIYQFTKACIDSASALEEVQNVVDTVFGESAELIDNFASNALKAFGLSEYSAKKYASTMGAMLKSMKVSDKEMITMSENLTALAGDMSSFYNISGDEAFNKIRSGISGETEPLKQLGINMSIANMEAYALSQGIDKSYNSMTQAEQALLRYNYLLDVTKDAQGDFARTSGNWANQTRLLSEQWNQFKAVLGQSFIQVLTPLIKYINLFMEKLILAGKYFQQFVYMITGVKPETKGATKAVESLGNSLDNVGSKAKKANKELKGLASFDKLNVLKDTSDSDNEGSAGMSLTDAYDVGELNTLTDSVDVAFDKLDAKFEVLKQHFKSIWDSSIVQSFVYAVTSYGQALIDFWVQLGTALWTNLNMTWTNIQGDVSTILSNISELWVNFWTDLGDTINEYSQPITEGIVGLFNSVWQDAVDPLIQYLTKAWADFTGILLKLWNEHGKRLLDNIAQFVQGTIELFQKIWDDIIEPIITPFLETLSWLWDKHLKGLVEEIGDFIGELVNGALEIWNKFIQPIIMWLIDKLAPAWAFLSQIVIGVVGTILGVVSDLVTGIIRVLKGIIQFITGIFTGDWKKAWEGVVSIFSGIFNGITGVCKGVINLVIDVLNGFIAGLNKISFDVPDWVPIIGGKKWGFDIKKINKFENGGVLTKPTYGLMAEYNNARFNPEIVSKENEMAKVFDDVMSKYAKSLQRSGQMTGTMKLVDANGVALGKVVVSAIEDYSDELGYNPL